jgi:hypothetical protein
MNIDLNSLFKSSQYILLVFTILVICLSAAYSKPEAQAQLLSTVGLQANTQFFDIPAIVPLLVILWIIYTVCQISILIFKINSDRVIVEGADHTDSCTGSKLHKKGDFCWIRAGGAKFMGIEGSSVIVNPMSHTHIIGNNVVMEAAVSPDTDLSDVPPELKVDVSQRSGGLLGVDRCSVGLLASRELQDNSEFDGSKFADAKTSDDKKQHTTSTFITNILTKNRAIDTLFLLFNDDTKSIEKKLASVKRIGNAANQPQKKGFLDLFMDGDQ